MVLAFESGDHPVEPGWRARSNAAPIMAARREPPKRADAHREGAAGAWRNAFIRMPYARERTIARGIINDTFETRDYLGPLRDVPRPGQGRDRARDPTATGRAGQVTCRFTHVYPDGPAPYFTFHAPGGTAICRAVAHHQVRRVSTR